jgi:hypothetical protein
VASEENVQGFSGASGPCSAFGRPWGNSNDARDQNHRVPDGEQAFTGWLSVTTAATGYMVPWAQLGLQSSSLYVPLPTAAEADHVVQVIAYRIAVLSPDNGQPEAQAGSCSGVALRSCPGARNVSAPVGDAGALCGTDGEAFGEAVTVGDAAGAAGEAADELGPAEGGELVAEPHAAASPVHASIVQASTVRASLDGASLDGASLDGASLDGASLDGASLDGASLDRASLDRASHDRAGALQACAAQDMTGCALRESTVPMIPTPVGDTTPRSA